MLLESGRMEKSTSIEKKLIWSLCYLINDDATGLTDEEGNAQPYSSDCPFSVSLLK